MIDQTVLDTLLDPRDPSLCYRVLTELLGRAADDAEVVAARARIPDSRRVRRIMAAMEPEGYWLFQGDGAGVRYRDYMTTHFVLENLAELGMDRGDPRVAMAAERYLDLTQPNGDYCRHMSCLYGLNIRTFVMLGYADDPRLRRTIDLMLSTERHDGGYLCDMHEGKHKSRPTKSCIRGCVNALMAYSALPDTWDTPRCRALVDYFLRRRVLYRMDDPDTPVRGELTSTMFPFTWRAGLLEVLYALSTMGDGQRDEMADAWALLETKREANGLYRMDWDPPRTRLRTGKRHAPNGWVTFYALLALARRGDV